MGITWFEESRTFKLDTPGSTYLMTVADDDRFLLHLYYGRKLGDERVSDLARLNEMPFVPSHNNRDRCSFNDAAPFEYPTHGLGDYRSTAFAAENIKGYSAAGLTVLSHRIYAGKPKLDRIPAGYDGLEGLPATFGGEDDCTTLEIYCRESINGLKLTLLYTVFEKLDVITRSVIVTNESDDPVKLKKVLSASLDLEGPDFDSITLHGSWARERAIERRPLAYGRFSASSVKGQSSHQENPFMALVASGADDEHGEVYGFNLVYSGSFTADVELTQFDRIRLVMGINPVDFCWTLAPGESFTAPEVVMVFSHEGIGAMTRTFHDLYRGHLIRSPYKDTKRPILINNWEATYFDFNTEKLLSIARSAKELGIEMLVMDDGWFGRRDDDNSSLGDWTVNESKLRGGLKALVDEVNRIGLKFGIWFEPEMVSPDSDLFRSHPDWAISIPGVDPVRSRNQYVLDLTRKEVRDNIFAQVSGILKSANIEYVKWDMNRQLTDMYSAGLDSDRQGELLHRYVLGVYELQERLLAEFPGLLLENCSSGGGRFDPGMLYFSPQIWTSDDTDAIERLRIQEGTAMIYPLSTMGAHVSDCPNHIVGRVTPFATRGTVALAGTFGYELDVTRIPEADRAQIPGQIALYHKYNDLVRSGDYYRLVSFASGAEWDSWEVVSKDRTEALVTVVEVLHRANAKSRRLRIKGLDPDRVYLIEETGERLRGDSLMYAGINITGMHHDFEAGLFHLVSGGTDNEQSC